LFALLLVAMASLVLGMGLPVTASYIVLATLSAPALLQLLANVEFVQVLSAGGLSDEVNAVLMLLGVSPEQGAMSLAQAQSLLSTAPDEMLGLLRPMLLDDAQIAMLLLASHLIIFWLSQDSNVTPPVCLCTFTAAAIAKSPPMATGFTSWKVAKGLYIIPLLFAYTPLVKGDWSQALLVFIFAVLGLYAFTLLMQGWQKRRLALWERAAMGALAMALLYPLALPWQLAALVMLLGFIFYWQRTAKLCVA
jgi:TRAP-type uncharacterized transport system fused permease subunit